jgi:cell division protein FtsQ
MKARAPRLHGASVSAPSEEVAVGESPAPPKAGRSAKSVPPGEGGSLLGRLALALKLLAGLAVVVVASSAVAYSLHRYALTTHRFAIQTLDVHGGRRLTREKVRAAAGIELGKNLFAFDTKKAEEALLADPWVSSARVTRELPGTLRVELTERDAYAVAVLGDRPWLVTREGEPFTEIHEDDPYDLPVLSGISAQALARDRAGAVERLKLGTDLLRQYERLGVAKVHPAQEVALGSSGHAVLTVGKVGITLELGRPPYARKLSMAERVIGELSKKGRAPGIVFLDNEAHPERVVVRMR